MGCCDCCYDKYFLRNTQWTCCVVLVCLKVHCLIIYLLYMLQLLVAELLADYVQVCCNVKFHALVVNVATNLYALLCLHSLMGNNLTEVFYIYKSKNVCVCLPDICFVYMATVFSVSAQNLACGIW